MSKTTFWIIESVTNKTNSFHLSKYNWLEEFADQAHGELALETKYNDLKAQKTRDEIMDSLEDEEYDEFVDPKKLRNEKPVGEILVEYDLIEVPEEMAWNKQYAAEHFHHHWKEEE